MRYYSNQSLTPIMIIRKSLSHGVIDCPRSSDNAAEQRHKVRGAAQFSFCFTKIAIVAKIIKQISKFLFQGTLRNI